MMDISFLGWPIFCQLVRLLVGRGPPGNCPSIPGNRAFSTASSIARLPWEVLDSVLGRLQLRAESVGRQDMDRVLDRRTLFVGKHGQGPSTTC